MKQTAKMFFVTTFIALFLLNNISLVQAAPTAKTTAKAKTTATTAAAKDGKAASSISTDKSTFPQITAKAIVLTDMKTGRDIYELNPDERIYPASTTKVLTALVALEKEKDLDTIMTATKRDIDAIGDGGMNMGIIPGEKLSLRELLYCMLVKSANEAANIIAENVGNSFDDFAAMSNNTAAELGATNTHFVNPHGMFDENHYTTAHDLMLIATKAMTYPIFRDVVKTAFYEVPPTNKHSKPVDISTTNKLLFKGSSLYDPDIIGIKTGYIKESGDNLISAAEKNNIQLMSVISGVVRDSKNVEIFKDTSALFDYAFSNFSDQKVMQKGAVLDSISVLNSKDPATRLDLVSDADIAALMPNDKSTWDSSNLKLTINKTVNSNIAAPIKKGDILGSVEVISDGVLLGKVNLVAKNDIEKDTMVAIKEAVTGPFKNPLFIVIIGIVGVAVVALLVMLLIKNIRKKGAKY